MYDANEITDRATTIYWDGEIRATYPRCRTRTTLVDRSLADAIRFGIRIINFFEYLSRCRDDATSPQTLSFGGSIHVAKNHFFGVRQDAIAFGQRQQDLLVWSIWQGGRILTQCFLEFVAFVDS